MALGPGEGVNLPGWHHPGGDTRMELIFVAEFRQKNTGQTTSEGGRGVVTRSQQTDHHFAEGDD